MLNFLPFLFLLYVLILIPFGYFVFLHFLQLICRKCGFWHVCTVLRYLRTQLILLLKFFGSKIIFLCLQIFLCNHNLSFCFDLCSFNCCISLRNCCTSLRNCCISFKFFSLEIILRGFSFSICYNFGAVKSCLGADLCCFIAEKGTNECTPDTKG